MGQFRLNEQTRGSVGRQAPIGQSRRAAAAASSRGCRRLIGPCRDEKPSRRRSLCRPSRAPRGCSAAARHHSRRWARGDVASPFWNESPEEGQKKPGLAGGEALQRGGSLGAWPWDSRIQAPGAAKCHSAAKLRHRAGLQPIPQLAAFPDASWPWNAGDICCGLLVVPNGVFSQSDLCAVPSPRMPFTCVIITPYPYLRSSAQTVSRGLISLIASSAEHACTYAIACSCGLFQVGWTADDPQSHAEITRSPEIYVRVTAAPPSQRPVSAIDARGSAGQPTTRPACQ